MNQSIPLLRLDTTRNTWCGHVSAITHDCDSAENAQQQSHDEAYHLQGFYFPPGELAKFNSGGEAQAFYKSKEYTVKKQ